MRRDSYQSMGFEAAALKGGFAAWRAEHPVEPVTTEDTALTRP